MMDDVKSSGFPLGDETLSILPAKTTGEAAAPAAAAFAADRSTCGVAEAIHWRGGEEGCLNWSLVWRDEGFADGLMKGF
jgi:hypothetical protein